MFILLRCRVPWLRVSMPCSSLGILFLFMLLSPGAVLTLIAPFLAAEGVVPGSFRSPAGTSSSSSGQVGFAAPAAHVEVPPKPPRAVASCLATIRRFARASGFSSKVAGRLGCSRRPSSVANYQSKWSLYRHWCADKGHSVSNPSISKVADFLVLALGS